MNDLSAIIFSSQALLKDKTADDILSLTVVEPAMGSAAFLNEAVNQLADAYLERKQAELGRRIPHDDYPQELQRVRMVLADRNVFGVDLNPVAVELAEVSLWLNAIYGEPTQDKDGNPLPLNPARVPWFGYQLFAGNSFTDADNLQPGASVSPIAGSIVDANDIPQLGWWGQATGQLGGPVTNASTNGGMGTGTSADMTTVHNFVVGSGGSGDTIDISLAAFSNLIRAADGDAPRPGEAVFSNIVGPGGTITVDDATVIRIESPGGFVGAADLAATLQANPIAFAAPQDGAMNHYLVAYQDTGGNVRIADMSIQSGGGSFTDTAGGATLAISDMAQLQGVTLSSLQASNLNLLAGTAVENSSYLDFTGWRINDATSVMDAYGLAASDVSEATFAGLNVALVLDRATDPTALLAQDWGTRQQTLAEMNDNGTLWTTYGADQTLYNSVVEQLKTNPDSRRIIVSAWNVADLSKMALMPCHAFFQFYVAPPQEPGGRGTLSCQLYQRSADIFLGVPFNIASYALLTHMVAQQCDLDVGDFIWTGGDCHIYSNHYEQVTTQLARTPYAYPTLRIKRKPASIFEYEYEDFEVLDYQCHPAIKAPVAV